MSPKTAAAPGSSKRLKNDRWFPLDVAFARHASLLYRRHGGSWCLVCSSSKRGRSSGEAFLGGDLKPGSRERLCSWQSLTNPSHVQLYVGNISFTITEADLQHIFEQFGSVTEIKVVTDRETGQPRGFAFVTMSNEPEGRAAIKSLDGKEFGGRPLKVSEARPKEDRPPRSSSRPRR